MCIRTLCSTIAIALIAASSGRAQPGSLPEEPGVYAETEAGAVALKQPVAGFDVTSGMRGATRRAYVFPIGDLKDVPSATDVTGFFVNLATVQDNAAAAAQMRFIVGEHVREPDFQVMAVRPAKFRTGMYRIGSPNLTREWLSAAYAKLTNARKWRDKHPRAIVGLILNEQTMYPVRIDEAMLTEKR